MNNLIAFFITATIISSTPYNDAVITDQKIKLKDIFNKIEQAFAPSKDSINYEIVDVHVQPSKTYKNIGELKQDSDIIVEGIIKNTASTIFKDIPFTFSTLKVTKVYGSNSNQVIEGSNIFVLETGGIMDKEFIVSQYKKKFPDGKIDKDKIKPQKMIIEGFPTLEKGDHVILLAKRYTGDITPPKGIDMTKQNCYTPAGLYQGKYQIDGEKITHTIPKNRQDIFQKEAKSKVELIEQLK